MSSFARLAWPGRGVPIEFYKDGEQQTVEARYLLVNFGRNVLARYIGQLYQPDATDEGSVFKINMLLRRLPKLKAKNINWVRHGAEPFTATKATNK